MPSALTSGRCLTALILGCLLALPCAAFMAAPSARTLAKHDNPFLGGTTLDMAKRRGKLGSIVDAGESVKKTRTVPKKRSKRLAKKSAASNKKASKEEASTISPLLQEWASGQQTEVSDEDVEEVSDSGASFSRFEDKKARRSAKKAAKQGQDEVRKALVLGLVEQLEEVLDDSKETNKKTTDMNDILEPIRKLLALPNANANIRQLTAGKSRQDYRLTWVGSDAAICHMGTGLHNVPLARLQEVFFSCLGKSRLELLEVIRIIGPFPNVRNTLEGSCKLGKRNMEYGGDDSKTVSELLVTYDSMIDGTGKQITAGLEGNVRNYSLQIAFCDENAIIAVVPPEDGGVRDDPLKDSGANILFFAREQNLDEKLDALRVL